MIGLDLMFQYSSYSSCPNTFDLSTRGSIAVLTSPLRRRLTAQLEYWNNWNKICRKHFTLVCRSGGCIPHRCAPDGASHSPDSKGSWSSHTALQVPTILNPNGPIWQSNGSLAERSGAFEIFGWILAVVDPDGLPSLKKMELSS